MEQSQIQDQTQETPEMPTKREKRENKYKEHSQSAAKAEQFAQISGNKSGFRLAEEHWRQAVIYARKPKNKEYCLKRAEFCQRQYHRPFSQAGE